MNATQRAGGALAILAVAGLGVSCSKSTKTESTAASPAGATAQCDLNNPGGQATASPPAATASHALHNVQHLGDKIISGAVPDSEAAFDELKAMGVKTIITVDGATPDLAAAEKRGMRYVHIPITYSQVSPTQQIEIARAVRDLPGPIFIHCHHGKHRGPAAAASAAVLLGQVTAEQGVAFMKKAGTAPTYTGLYQCVATAVAASATALDAAPADFPNTRHAEGIVASMIEVDKAYEHLGYIKEAGWAVPKDHPDLVPAAEAGRLTDNMRFSGEDARCKEWGADFAKRLAEAVGQASKLEEGIVRGVAKEELDGAWKGVVASCKDCHVKYRDVVR